MLFIKIKPLLILYKSIFQLDMKIYDCFMFFKEEMIFNIRLNIMDIYIDKFVIIKTTYKDSGRLKKLFFDISKLSKFKNKIIYNIINKGPPTIDAIYEDDDE